MTVRIRSSDMIHTPGMFDRILRPGGLADSLTGEITGEANRTYLLAALAPTAPAGVLLDVAQGNLAWRAEGDVVVIDHQAPPKPAVAIFEARVAALPSYPASVQEFWDAIDARDTIIAGLLAFIRES